MTTNGRFALPLSDGKFYDTLRHRTVEEQDLAAGLLLSGQEHDAIRDVMLDIGPTGIDIIPSWECNLRCPHCYVGSKLKKPSGSTQGDTDPVKLKAFVNKARKTLKIPYLYFVGGEPFLHPDLYRNLQDLGVPFHVVTNGYWDFDEMRDVVAMFEEIVFSIDGLPEDHNKIRRTLDHGDNPFLVTYKNLRRTAKEFPDIHLQVQGSMVHRDYSEEEIQRYSTLMVLAGVKGEDIQLGVAASTDRHQGGPDFGNKVGRVMRKRPCCDYKLGHHLIVNGNLVYNSYYLIGSIEPLGTLDDEPEEIMANYRKAVLKAPILKDKQCMNECKAVGVCWGGCSNTLLETMCGYPSTICDRPFKESQIDALARGVAIEEDVCRS